jgi:hypothetical protein
MKQTINRQQFIRAFETAGRGEQFSYDARSAIFDWIENYEDETGEQIELDVIAICCDWSEDSPEEIAENYGIDISGYATWEEKAEAVMDYLQDNTGAAISLDNGKIVYIQF